MATTLRPGFKAEAERIALALRAELGLTASDRLDCRDLAAHLGIPVMALRDLGAEGTCAASIRQLAHADAGFSALTICADTRRLIVYNQRHPPGRRANSLAHELSHIILEHPPAPALDESRSRLWDPQLEAEADWQAGALLVPRDGALAWLRRERDLANGEKHFGVSRALFLRRVHRTARSPGGFYMGKDTWDPEQYERFQAERSQPFFDLLALVQPRRGMRVVDLGCGTGELTCVLHQRLEACETVGIDTSQAMLAKSSAFAGEGLRFEYGDIATFAANGPYDLIFSNAALHWVPHHDELLARLTVALADGGQIAVQVPANHHHPSHVAAAEVVREQPFRDALGGYLRQTPVLTPEEYATLLYRLGYRRQHVRLQVYGHQLASRDEVVEWVKGTLLTDYQRHLPPNLYAHFLDRYRHRLLPRLDDSRPYFYPFKRILFWARR